MTRSTDDVAPRRGFLRQVVGAGSAISALSFAKADAADLAPAPSAAQPLPGYLSLGRAEAGFVEALVTVLCPADGLTPDGVACGLAVFIDRQLAGDFGRGAGLYRSGPWQTGKPQHGYQLPMTPAEHFKAGIAAVDTAAIARHGMTFERLPAAAADALLHDVTAGVVVDEHLSLVAWFDELVYPLFVQACFADPIYGGNVDRVFWQLIGYPGLPATHALDMRLYRGKPFPGAADPKTIVDFG